MTDLFSLTGRNLLISGASRGLGCAVARDAARLGARLTLVARGQADLDETLATLDGEGHQAIAADIATPEGRRQILERITPLDGLFNTAGTFGHLTPFHLEQEKSLRNVMEANFFAPLLFLQALLKAKRIANEASLVFTSSVAVGTCPIASAAYAASKAALSAAMRSVALDVARRGIRVNTVAYGYVMTPAMSEIGLAPERLLQPPLPVPAPEAVTGAPLFLLSPASRWMTRSNVAVDGGVTLRQNLSLL